MNTNEISAEAGAKKRLNDIELTARIILAFYEHPKRDYLTEEEIIAHLEKTAEFDRKKVPEILEILFKEYLIRHQFSIDEKGKRNGPDEWRWSIRMADGTFDGDSPWHHG